MVAVTYGVVRVPANETKERAAAAVARKAIFVRLWKLWWCRGCSPGHSRNRKACAPVAAQVRRTGPTVRQVEY